MLRKPDSTDIGTILPAGRIGNSPQKDPGVVIRVGFV